MITPSELAQLSEDEMRSLSKQTDLAYMFADIMQLNGAGVMIGDVMQAMARLGLRFVSVEDGDISDIALTRYDALTESRDCPCGDLWERLKDAEGSGVGWWHRDDGHHYTRKCPKGKPKPRSLLTPRRQQPR